MPESPTVRTSGCTAHAPQDNSVWQSKFPDNTGLDIHLGTRKELFHNHLCQSNRVIESRHASLDDSVLTNKEKRNECILKTEERT